MSFPSAPLASLPGIELVTETLNSSSLQRTVQVDVVLPPGYSAEAAQPYPVLYLHDGQDLARLRLPATLNSLYRQHTLRPFVLVAIHAGARIHEYGTAARPDFLGRGEKAGLFTEFMLRELLPRVQATYHVSADPAQTVVAGFSLSGLAAFDFVWHHPGVATRAGVFSGSFWWRSKALSEGYTDADRIMHRLVRQGQAHPDHRFWLQTGTLDETNDRNHNGIIDAIEDTLDLMAELARHGLPDHHTRYVEVIGGRHNQHTWGRIMPDFLRWAFGVKPLKPLNTSVVNGRRGVRHRWDSLRRLAQHRRAAVRRASRRPPPEEVWNPTARPVAGQYPAYFENYFRHVPAETNPLTLLTRQLAQLRSLFGQLTEEQALLAYAPGKWSSKEMLLHIIDTERIFTYRALRIARGDQTALPGFDENAYAAASDANGRSLRDLLVEFAAVRQASIALFRSFSCAQLDRVGVASAAEVSARALLFVVPGHAAHHAQVLRERYLPALASRPLQH